MKLVKFFAIAVAAFAVACGPEEQKVNKPNFELTESTIYCDVTAGAWENCNVWAWTEGGDNYTQSGNWPGEQLTETEIVDGKTCYVWNAPKEIAGKEIGFIVNDFGTNGKQTVDLKLVVEDGAMVVLTSEGSDGKWLASVNGEETEEPEPTPEPVVVLGDHTWGLIGSFNEWSADSAMEIVDGWAVGTITVDAGAEFKVRADGGWDINYGFAATEELTAAPVDGTSFPATFNSGNIKVDEAGTYEVSLTIEGENEYFKVLKK